LRHIDNTLDALVARLKKAKPLLAGYLETAASSSISGDRITLTFADPFTADSVRDSQKTIEELASEAYGRRMSVEVETASKPEAKPVQGSLREDPIVKAFQNHLGGEIVEGRKTKESR
jgi:hypothetical protein